MYFESHAHYDDKRFDQDRNELLGTVLKDSGVRYVINIGADMVSSRKSVELANQYEFVYATVGVHPHSASQIRDKDLEILKNLAQTHKKVVGIGEIGLDFYYDNSPREIQISRFKDQLTIAKELELPLSIHSREADGLTFDIIKENGPFPRGGVIHCYGGSAELAEEYVKLGFMIGVGGIVTYQNARKLIQVVETISLDSILLETDCPYLSPVPNRGKRNSSQNLVYICEKIAQIKQISTQEVAAKTMENGKQLFLIK